MTDKRLNKVTYDDNHRKLFDNVVFLVEANDHEHHQFWVDYHYQPRANTPVVKSWEQEPMGKAITIGEIDERPIVVSIFYAKLNSKRVAFYEGCSQLVDHQMIEDWLKYFTLNSVRWDNGNRWAHCDSNNFHHCLDAIGVLDEFRTLKKNSQES